MGGAGRLLAVDDRGRGRRARRRRRPRNGQRRPAVGTSLQGRCRRLAAVHRALGGDHERAAVPEPLLHPAVQGGRPERRRHLQRRKRRADTRPARGHRRGLPRARPARTQITDRCHDPRLAPGRGCHDQVDHAERSGLAPLQWRRLRRQSRNGCAMGAERARDRAPLAGPVSRAGGACAGDRRLDHGRLGARQPDQLRIRGRTDPGAGLGASRPRGSGLRDGPDGRLDWVRQRQAGRLGRTARVVRRRRRPTRPGCRRRTPSRSACEHDRALCHQPRRPDDVDRLVAGGSVARVRLAGHGDGHDHGRQHGLRRGHQHRREQSDDVLVSPSCPRWQLQHRRPGQRRHHGPQRRRRQPERRNRARHADRGVRFRPWHAAA